MQIDVKDRMDHRSNSKHTHTQNEREKKCQSIILQQINEQVST